MKLNKGQKDIYSKYLMFGAIASIVFSAVGWVGSDIWLASTQWLLVALVLAAFGIYLRLG